MPTRFKHGLSAYANGLCKCDVCRRAGNRHANKSRARRYRHTAEHGLPDGVAHGRSAYINWGCHCEVCSGAQSRYNQDYKNGVKAGA